MKHKEATGAKVTVELNENLIGCCGHGLLNRGSTELTNLR